MFLFSSKVIEDGRTKLGLPKENEFVKIGRSGERFWVEVIFVDILNKMVTGVVDNDLLKTSIHGLDYKDVIIFHASEIIEILDSDDE